MQGGSIGALLSTIWKIAKPILPALGIAGATGAVSGLSAAVGNKAGKAITGEGVLSDAVGALASPAARGDELLKHGFTFTNNQINKIAKSIKDKTPFNLRLTKDRLRGPHVMPLNKTMMDRVQKASQAGNGTTLKMSGAGLAEQLHEHGDHAAQEGGFLQFVLPFLAPLLGNMLSGNGVDVPTEVQKKPIIAMA